MPRCGCSWVMETLKKIYKIMHGKDLRVHYEVNRSLASNHLLSGINVVYDIDPKILLNLGYDKILIIKRDKENLEKSMAIYHGYQENYGTLENMKIERPGFFQKFDLLYDLIYNQNINDSRILIVSLEDLNNHVHEMFNKIIDFLEFKMTFRQKMRLFYHFIRNKIKPLVIPVHPPERDFEIYSTILSKEQKLCNRLQYLQKIRENKR